MDIIQAWKKAKEGQKLIRLNTGSTRIKSGQLSETLLVKYEDELLADDWEVVREPLVWEGDVEWDTYGSDGNWVIPIGTGLSQVNKELKHLFLGKRTKIRIEEIIE